MDTNPDPPNQDDTNPNALQFAKRKLFMPSEIIHAVRKNLFYN